MKSISTTVSWEFTILGKTTVDVEPDGSCLILLPNSMILWRPSKASAERAIRDWCKKHVGANHISTLEINWRYPNE